MKKCPNQHTLVVTINEYFINRNGHAFYFLMEFYRTGLLVKSSGMMTLLRPKNVHQITISEKRAERNLKKNVTFLIREANPGLLDDLWYFFFTDYFFFTLTTIVHNTHLFFFKKKQISNIPQVRNAHTKTLPKPKLALALSTQPESAHFNLQKTK